MDYAMVSMLGETKVFGSSAKRLVNRLDEAMSLQPETIYS